jgi:hypothetical protein
MKNINDKYKCNPCPNKKRGEFCNAKGLATPTVDVYL